MTDEQKLTVEQRIERIERLLALFYREHTGWSDAARRIMYEITSEVSGKGIEE